MTISVTLDLEDDVWRLMVSDARLSSAPAGARLFRAEPHPVISFEHSSREAAETDAATLRAYLADLPKPRGRKRAASYQEGD